jgi:hypothetical protein
MEQYAYLVWSLLFLALWLVLFLANPPLRWPMVWVSLITAPLGLSQTHFVPKYWVPPTIFDLARRKGFDLESIIFCFAIGGVGPILYKALVPGGTGDIKGGRGYALRYQLRYLSALSPVVVFVALEFTTSWNPAYTSSFGMFIGALISLLCRPDLKARIWFGGGLFLTLYFTCLKLMDFAFPFYIERFWNLSALSGVLIWGVPLEECLFAVSFGMMWSSLYEHLFWPKPLESLEAVKL